jgi:hypothetical protein
MPTSLNYLLYLYLSALFCAFVVLMSIFGGLSINSSAAIQEVILAMSPYDALFDTLSVMKNDKLNWVNRNASSDGVLKITRPADSESALIDFNLLLNRVAYKLNVNVSFTSNQSI